MHFIEEDEEEEEEEEEEERGRRKRYYVSSVIGVWCQRPCHAENIGSRPITEVKLRWAGLVLAWVTGWEYLVLLAAHFVSFVA